MVSILTHKLVYSILIFIVWVILVESFQPIFLVFGVFVSVFTVWFTFKYLPPKATSDINFVKLIFYPFYLVGLVYLSAIYVVRIALLGERCDIVSVDTDIKSPILSAMLEASLTLTPGSIFIERDGNNNVVLLWLRLYNEPDPKDIPNLSKECVGDIESKLIKAQKKVN